ncbi:N-6 DNA methylase [Actinoplanes sp. TRM 88003]|uniref:N-6 DNA methylase n=1 Tax=Paractinoplanes aksuensis TaxID=2939490 RepID=A0ABT1DLW2_9ACTN|nr:N-6 DNA methylase [Actinoplanes aksuensis]MCO8271799.1 N-6 DNA methylase [Actinoplanes aksuensis]
MQQRARVTAADIARLAGVGRAAVSNWRKRYDTFPPPVGGTAASPQFDLDDIERWLADQGKLPAVADEDRLWRSLLAAAGDPAEALAVAGDHLLGRKQLPYEDLRALLDALAPNEPSAALEALWTRFADLPGQRAVTTPDALADLMVSLAAVRNGTVLDPACGTGRLLRAAVRSGATTLYGQDVDGAATRLASLWLTANNLDGEIRTGDSLRHDAFPDLTVDAVVGNLPFGLTNWGHEDLGYDRRWEFGVPPRTEPELAWVQHALAHLGPGGRAVLLMPPSAASRRAGRRIRAELLRRGAVQSIIALPPGAAAPHAVGLHLWVLSRVSDPAPEVRLIDASALEIDAILDEVGYSVPVVDLLDEEVDLSPGRRAPAAVTTGATFADVLESHNQLRAVVESLQQLVPSAMTDVEGGSTPLPTVSVGDLLRAGSVQLLGPVRPTPGDPSTQRVWTAPDILVGRPPTGSADTALSPEITVQPGDIAVPVLADALTARVVVENGFLLGRGVQLLRCDPQLLDPWFLAGYLRTSANERQASRGSGSNRFDLRRAQVPRIPLAEQRQHGEIFRQMHQFDDAVRKAAELSNDFTRKAVDGLAGGLLGLGECIDESSIR